MGRDSNRDAPRDGIVEVLFPFEAKNRNNKEFKKVRKQMLSYDLDLTKKKANTVNKQKEKHCCKFPAQQPPRIIVPHRCDKRK